MVENNGSPAEQDDTPLIGEELKEYQDAIAGLISKVKDPDTPQEVLRFIADNAHLLVEASDEAVAALKAEEAESKPKTGSGSEVPYEMTELPFPPSGERQPWASEEASGPDQIG